MKRTTIDFGIDLGTTNSAVAVLKGVATNVIKNNADADITPSAVSIDKKGTVLVGQRAKNRIYDHPDDAYVEFKRRMGSNHVYQFKSSGQSRKPEELSAEVLKSLRADVQQRLGETVDACVVTVPAAFELHQCDATRKAAEAAGFRQSPLLQEPVAAALAYGFQAEQEKAYWLVYDFGGGTFDAAIIKAEEGTIHVVNHGGDNFLGGSDIDWALVERVLTPRLLGEYDLKQFNRGNPQWRQAFAKLKRAAEVAKIDLSRGESALLETCKFSDGNGTEIEFECEITRGELLKVAEPIIARSVEICQRVLKEKNLGVGAVEKMILVGGPTLAPYFRELLSASIGIPLDHSVDPLTVVASGAAVFAGTQRLEQAAGATPAPADGYVIDLKYKAVSTDLAPLIGGRVSGATQRDFTGYSLELVNEKSQWRSGRIALEADGVFMTELHAERGERNTFGIELFDPNGTKQAVTPDSLHYTVGAAVEEQPLINSMGIGLGNNEYDKLFEKGHGLPLRARRDYRTIHAVQKGQSAALFKIPVVEGESERADRNRLVGTLEISGAQVSRDLPVGSDVEVTLHIDESRIITVSAHVPMLDEDFAAKLDLQQKTPDPDALKREYDAEMRRFHALKAKAQVAGGESAAVLLQKLEKSPLLQELKDALGATKGDPDVAAKFEKQLLALKQALDEAEDILEWPALVAEIRTALSRLDQVVNQHATPEQRVRALELVQTTNAAIAEQKFDALRRKRAHIDQLYWEILMAQPQFWVQQFLQLETQRAAMRDPVQANRLFELGRGFLQTNNAAGLQAIVTQLWPLLPQALAAQVSGGYQSILAR